MTLLLELLEKEDQSLTTEINKTDDYEYKNLLKWRRNLVEATLVSLKELAREHSQEQKDFTKEAESRF